MEICAIDPGPENSAFVRMLDSVLTFHTIKPNEEILTILLENTSKADVLVIEMVASYGMPVGVSIFETVLWIGRFMQAAIGHVSTERVFRKDVKLHFCGSSRAKDSNIRQAILDRYGSSRKVAIGTKKQKGPLYGVKKDEWSALAVALYYLDKLRI